MMTDQKRCGLFGRIWRGRLAPRAEAWGVVDLGVCDGRAFWRNEVWRRSVDAAGPVSHAGDFGAGSTHWALVEDGMSRALKLWRTDTVALELGSVGAVVGFAPARCVRCVSGCTVLVARMERVGVVASLWVFGVAQLCLPDGAVGSLLDGGELVLSGLEHGVFGQ